jgi:MOSC domain-containing protein YiiM
VGEGEGEGMKLISVNVSSPQTVMYQGKSVTTGIFKKPVSGRVMLRILNLDGDQQADRKVHGGVDMAVYVYPIEHYGYWQTELARTALPHGQFGENLTVEGSTEDNMRMGDVVSIGEALLQVTQPRIPCYKLVMRMQAGSDFAARFLKSGRVGFYLRVLQEGAVGAGDAIELAERDDDAVTIAEFLRIYTSKSRDPATLERVLAARHLGDAWRRYFEKRLQASQP